MGRVSMVRGMELYGEVKVNTAPEFFVNYYGRKIDKSSKNYIVIFLSQTIINILGKRVVVKIFQR